MKKKIVILSISILMVALFFAGCGGGAKSDPKYVGVWKTTDISMDGESYFEFVGEDVHINLDLKEDGTAILFGASADDNEEGTWVSIDGGIKIDDDDTLKFMDVEGQEGQLQFDAGDGMIYILTKQ